MGYVKVPAKRRMRYVLEREGPGGEALAEALPDLRSGCAILTRREDSLPRGGATQVYDLLYPAPNAGSLRMHGGSNANRRSHDPG